jgi:hypothetical protein
MIDLFGDRPIKFHVFFLLKIYIQISIPLY